jgi:hypothetical protein
MGSALKHVTDHWRFVASSLFALVRPLADTFLAMKKV